MSERHLAPSTVAMYKGPPQTVQIDGVWLEPGEIIAEPRGLVRSLLEVETYFDAVDTTISSDQDEADDLDEEV